MNRAAIIVFGLAAFVGSTEALYSQPLNKELDSTPQLRDDPRLKVNVKFSFASMAAAEEALNTIQKATGVRLTVAEQKE